MPGPQLTDVCTKCGRRLPHADIPPAYCSKCELINALTVEQYTTHQRTEDPEAPHG
jgi:hypothetical protein